LHNYLNFRPPELYEIAAMHISPADPSTRETTITSLGALAAYSGHRTGRTPKDKRIVRDSITENEIWWGDVNIPLEPSSYQFIEERAISYLNSRPRVKYHVYLFNVSAFRYMLSMVTLDGIQTTE
jgi:phosphoenolpyruvate carboxykinase (ATP)